MLTFVHILIDIPAVNGLLSVHISVTINKLNYKTVGIRLHCIIIDSIIYGIIMYMYRCVHVHNYMYMYSPLLPFIHVPVHY